MLSCAPPAAGVDEDEAMYTFQDKDILECEFYVVEALQFDLILHHPFPSLLQCVLLRHALLVLHCSDCAGGLTN